MVETHNSKIAATRMNTYMVILASRIDSEMQNMKNCFDMAQLIELNPNKNYPM